MGSIPLAASHLNQITMKKDLSNFLIAVLALAIGLCLQSCYSVSKVGNCKYYTPKFVSSKHRAHAPVGF